MQPSNSKGIPKAVLYCFPTSVWCSVVYLALHEKGFGSDEIETRTVDLFQGENFAPSYLRINPKATVPSLVVPLEKSLAPDCEVRFKAINDTRSIVEFLDKSRSAISKTHTTSSAPAPALAPVSLELSALSNQIIDLLHSPAADPNFLSTAATTPEELASPSKVRVKDFLTNRQRMLEIHIASPGSGKSGTEPVHLSPKTISFFQNKLDINSKYLSIYTGSILHTSLEARDFFTASTEAWTVGLRNTLDELESIIVGPFALGDHLSLADMHMMAWLARVVSVAGGKMEAEGIAVLEGKIGNEWRVGNKVAAYWEAALDRPSFLKVYKDGLH